MFSDEALYIEWGWRAIHYGQWFHALHDAKQPFIMWFYGIGQTIFSDPLWGSRIVSVVLGFFNLLGIYTITKKYSDSRTAVIASLLYIITPFFLFYDRQATVDTALITFSIWAFYFFEKSINHQSIKNSLLTGLFLGLGFFTKSTGALYLAAYLIIQLLLIFKRPKERELRASLSIICLMAFLFINISLFIQPGFWSTVNTNSRWSFTLGELAGFPFSQWLKNIYVNSELAFIHLGPIYFFIILLSIWQFYKSGKNSQKILLLWLLLPMAFYIISLRFANSMLFRYLTPLLPLALIPVSVFLSKHRIWIIPAFLIPAILSFLIIFNPVGFFRLQSKLTRFSYITGYVTGNDTGFELNAIVSFFRDVSREKPILLGIAVHSFNPESGILDYFRKDPNVTVSYLDSGLFAPGVLDQIDCLASEKPLYFVAKLNDTVGLEKYFEKLTVITNPYNQDYATIYTLKKNCTGNTVNLTLDEPIDH